MEITLNRFTAGLLLIALYPIVLLVRLFKAVTGGGKKLAYVGTVEGDPLAYVGDRPIIIAVWATWASVWQAATAGIVEQLKGEFSGKCEFAYVECVDRSVMDAYGASVVPVLILRLRGQDLARFVNALDAEQVRKAIRECIG
jgi:hypothetical protein